MTHFYPELGATAPVSAIVTGRIVRKAYYVKWTEANHAAVLAAFARLKLSASRVEPFVTVKGESKWSADMTPKAYAKLQAAGVAATEMLLD